MANILKISNTKINLQKCLQFSELINNQVDTLYLYQNLIDDEASYQISKFIVQNINIVKFIFSHNLLSETGFDNIFNILPNSNIKILHISLWNLDTIIDKITNTIIYNSKINSLSIYGNYTYPHNLIKLSNSINNNKFIQKLDLVTNLDNQSIFNIARNDNLTNLKIRYGSLDDSGLILLSNTFSRNTKLKYIDLSFNNLSYSINYLVLSITNNYNLNILYLNCNLIGPNEAIKLANAIKNNTSITELYLSYNKIGTDGALEIANMIQINNTLITLSLSYNNIGHHGISKLLESIKNNLNIQNFYIDGNQIISIDSINQIINNNNVLRTFSINNHDLDSDCIISLQDNLRENYSLTKFNIEPIKNLDIQNILDRNTKYFYYKRFYTTKSIISPLLE